jgi:signal transduction histidine kinase
VSLRARIFIGSIVWTAGLLAFSHFLFLHLIGSGRAHRMEVVVHRSTLVAFAGIFMLAGILFLRSGVRPLQRLKTQMAAVRAGSAQRVEGRYPGEVQPLIDDLNALLDHREKLVARAIAKAGDLAHGLKTPLAVLAQEAERADPEVASAIRQQVERMRQQIDYHLAHARAAASGATPGTRCSVLESAEGLARTLLRLRGVPIELSISPEHAVRAEREDLDEMLGNLLDNACKWARSRVTLTSAEEEGQVVITVDDDGPGLDASMHEAVLQRGVRADEAAPGSGLGLAIVRDLAELYGGAITLGASGAGGVRARLALPRG